MSDSCWWSHDWGKWEEKVIPINVTLWNGKSIDEDTVKRVQRRVCQQCGKIQEERLD